MALNEEEKREIELSTYALFKRTHDVNMLNPYFMFDGHRFTMPEAIDYIMPRAEEEILKCPGEDLQAKGKYWSWAYFCNNLPEGSVDPQLSRALQIEDVPVENDPSLRREETLKHGLLPAQVFFMKTAHEYYITQYCTEHDFRLQVLSRRNFDIDKIVDLMKSLDWNWDRFEQNEEGFRKIKDKSIDEVCRHIFKRPD